MTTTNLPARRAQRPVVPYQPIARPARSRARRRASTARFFAWFLIVLVAAFFAGLMLSLITPR